MRPWKVTLPFSSHGAPPIVNATPDEIGMTSREISIPSLSRIRDSVWENHVPDSVSIPLRSSTHFSPCRTSSGPTSSPFSLLILPPEPRTSIGMWIDDSLVVKGCLGFDSRPESDTPAESARAEPVPEPSL